MENREKCKIEQNKIHSQEKRKQEKRKRLCRRTKDVPTIRERKEDSSPRKDKEHGKYPSNKETYHDKKEKKYSDDVLKDREHRLKASVITPSNKLKSNTKETGGACEGEWNFKEKLQPTTKDLFGTSFINSTPFLRTGKYAQIVQDLHLKISDETYLDIAANLPYFERKYKNMTDPPEVTTLEPMFSDMRILSDWDSENSADPFQDSYFANYTNTMS